MFMNNQNLIKLLKSEGIYDNNVIESIKTLIREKFILSEYISLAYSNQALPIVSGQTISQPYTVAFMIQELELKKHDKILEIGAGSGWNSALINFITKNTVYSIEYDKKVAEFAKNNLKNNNISGIRIIIGDGNKGYEAEAPYDKIIVTAACSRIPIELVNQLNNKGILLVPVGNLYEQDLLKIKKVNETLETKNLGKFVFVPLIGKYGFKL